MLAFLREKVSTSIKMVILTKAHFARVNVQEKESTRVEDSNLIPVLQNLHFQIKLSSLLPMETNFKERLPMASSMALVPTYTKMGVFMRAIFIADRCGDNAK